MRGGKRNGCGRAATGRTTGVISLRVPAEVRELYDLLTDAEKRSLNGLVASKVRSRAAKRRLAAREARS